MRRLYINSSLVDIDDTTAIGVDIQAYDLKEPGKRKVSVSNTFTIPKTSNNLEIFGHPDNPHSQDKTIYNIMTCDYWINNIQLIKNAQIRIEEIGDRIKLYVTYKAEIWDLLKLESWADFSHNVLEFLNTVKGIPVYDAALSINDFGTDPSFTNFITTYANSTENIIIPFFLSNPYANGSSLHEYLTEIVLNEELITSPTIKLKGGHICIFAKCIFEYIEWKYSVNFLTSVTTVAGNLWDQSMPCDIYTPIREFVIKDDICDNISGCGAVAFGDSRGFAFGIADADFKYLPYDDVKDKDGKTLYDFVNSFFQLFNVIVEPIKHNGADAIMLCSFDLLPSIAPVVDFSNKITGKPTFKTTITGFAQKNRILFSDIFPEGSKLQDARELISNNKNLNSETTLFTIDAYIPNYKVVTGYESAADLSIQESFKTFQFFYSGVTSASKKDVRAGMKSIAGYYKVESANIYMRYARHYSIAASYYALDNVIKYPKVYTIKKWLTINDIFELRFFSLKFIRQLNGSFFISKISGFNPEKSNEPTTIELIRINSKTPTPIYRSDYYTDGDTPPSIFTDGNGNNFY